MPCMLCPGDGDVGKQHRERTARPGRGEWVAQELSRDTKCCGSGQRVRISLLARSHAEGKRQEGWRGTGRAF